MALKWGICGSGSISKSFVTALQSSPDGDHKVVAVAARKEENAQEFASKYSISKAYGGYQQLAKDDEIDIVYIGVINSEHLNACELMLNNGKHVLCEKPMGLTKGQVQRILDLAKEKKLFCMEAIVSRFCPAYSKLRDIISTGEIGDVKVVFANMGKNISDMERIAKNELGGGGILDIGVYLIQLAVMVYGGKVPMSVLAKGFLTESGVDDTAMLNLQFPNFGLASLTCSISTQLNGEAHICGTKGRIKLNSVNRPTKLEVTDADGKTTILDFPAQGEDIRLEFLRKEADITKQCIKSGQLESSLMSHSDSLIIADIMDKARYDVGYQLDYERANTIMSCQ